MGETLCEWRARRAARIIESLLAIAIEERVRSISVFYWKPSVVAWIQVLGRLLDDSGSGLHRSVRDAEHQAAFSRS